MTRRQAKIEALSIAARDLESAARDSDWRDEGLSDEDFEKIVRELLILSAEFDNRRGRLEAAQERKEIEAERRQVEANVAELEVQHYARVAAGWNGGWWL